MEILHNIPITVRPRVIGLDSSSAAIRAKEFIARADPCAGYAIGEIVSTKQTSSGPQIRVRQVLTTPPMTMDQLRPLAYEITYGRDWSANEGFD